MGLDLYVAKVDYDDPELHARWAYSGFNEFRERLARAIGIPRLSAMEGFGGERPWSEVEDDLVPLLHHSDCDGELDYTACAKVAPRLREIVETWHHDDIDRQNALRLCAMMDLVVEGGAHMVVFR
jgi:hypothetical protein